jgi:hypothetical protein
MDGNERFLSVFGIHHREQQDKIIENRQETDKLMNEIAKPVEGLDILHEDSKKETQMYQDIYDSVLMKEVV